MATRTLSRVSSPAMMNTKHFLRRQRLTTTTATPTRHLHHSLQQALSHLLHISPEVSSALSRNRPLVALESTIYTHGALGKDLDLEEIVRAHGAVPAVCGVLAGKPTVGLTPAEVERMVREGAAKASRRDLARLAARGLLGTAPGDRPAAPAHGGTTIAGTMILARLAGIRVFGTGGLGGVHRGGESSMDVSADLTELGRTRVAVVSSGCKGFLDIPRTLEFLETQGVLVSTFAEEEWGEGKGVVDFPAFWARESGVPSPSAVRDEKEAAAIILAQEQLGIETGLLFANPIPKEFAIPRAEMEGVIELAVKEAQEKGFTGNANTPYILRRIRELTDGRSVPANKALVQANVARAAKIAVELAKMMDGAPVTLKSAATISKTTTSSDVATQKETGTEATTPKPVDVLVAGAVALDLSCDYNGGDGDVPRPHTSNPSTISHTVGGVGHNIALAAHRVSKKGKVRLCSMVGHDVAASRILAALEASGLDTDVRQVGDRNSPTSRTPQYVAVNDAKKNLVIAMSDFSLFDNSFPASWKDAALAAKPKWLVVDANWSAKDLHVWVKAAREQGAKVAYEPVSEAKSQRLFDSDPGPDLGVFPSPVVDLATPNQLELAAMYRAAAGRGHFDTAAGWFEVLDAFGIMPGARERFVGILGGSTDLVDAGVPVQSINLLPYIPTIITKLGARGALLTTVLARDDPRLSNPAEKRYVVGRCASGRYNIGGVYMRLFPAVEKVENVVSVNGIGDTFMGVLVAGLAMGGKVEQLMDVAQQAAVMTLKSKEAVNPEVVGLNGRLQRIAQEFS